MSKRKYSLWLHYGLSVVIVLLTLLGAAWYVTDRFHEFFVQQQRGTLESRAMTVKQAIKSSSDITHAACLTLQTSDPEIRVTIIGIQGGVLCDSEVDEVTMENHAKRPEISQALINERGSAIRFSKTLQTSMLYLAIPYYESEKLVAVIRTAIPLLSIEKLLNELYQNFMTLLVVLFAIISLVIINIYRKINQPLSEITVKANHFAHGDFSATIADYEIKEIAELGMALNAMVEQLGRLEHLRQDFVANVSHELKTPIATIKSYVETLLDGSQHDPEDIEYFLNVVRKQNDRLAAIVDDLLMLSRLESSPVNKILELNEHDACDLLQACIGICQVRADVKNIVIDISCEPTCLIKIDYSLMTQALVNLLDNAIKYSHEGTTITLTAERVNGQTQLRVCDQGPGIPEEDIPRLFERFYRVDKSRSRRIGGTGLGLAIVKHIANVHKGRIHVVNNHGAGCCFTIVLSA